MDIFREAVSKNKRRFKEDGYNLDLSYISTDFIKQSLQANGTPSGNQHEVSTQPHKQLIAMGYPAKRIEASYRNRCDDVLRFLDERHPEHYKVFNLCTERKYSLDSFGTRSVVEDYGFEDHKPPQFQSIGLFCREVSNYLKNPENVAVIHCKAGKGRTGLMICCYLIHLALLNADESGWFHFAKRHPKNPLHALVEAALNHFSRERTHDSKGVTIPSQRRYVELYAIYLSSIHTNLYNPLTEQHRTYRCLESISFEHNSAPGTWSLELSFRLPHELPHHQENFLVGGNYADGSWAQWNQCYNHEVFIHSENIDKVFLYTHEHQPAVAHTWKRRSADTHHSTFLLHEDFCVKFRRKDQFEFEFWFNARFLKDNLCRSERHLFFEIISFKEAQHLTHTQTTTTNTTQNNSNKLKKLLVLQRNQIDKIYKNKFDEKFSNCRIICQFGEERPLDRNTWRTFFTSWSRALQTNKSRGGVWNVISSTINGYSLKGGQPLPADAPISSRTLDRAISLSQPNLFAPEESSVRNGEYQFKDTSIKNCNLPCQDLKAKRDTLEEKMKNIDDDSASEDDEDCCSPVDSTRGFGGINHHLLNKPYNRSSNIYRCLRSSERYGRPNMGTEEFYVSDPPHLVGLSPVAGGFILSHPSWSSSITSYSSFQLQPPAVSTPQKNNQRASPSPDNRLHSKSGSVGMAVEKHSLSPQGPSSSSTGAGGGWGSRTKKSEKRIEPIGAQSSQHQLQHGARLSSSSFCEASDAVRTEGGSLANSSGNRSNELLDDQRLFFSASVHGRSHSIEDGQSFSKRVFAPFDQPVLTTSGGSRLASGSFKTSGGPSASFDLSASLPASSIYIPRGPPVYERNRVFNLGSSPPPRSGGFLESSSHSNATGKVMATDMTDDASAIRSRTGSDVRSPTRSPRQISRLNNSKFALATTQPSSVQQHQNNPELDSIVGKTAAVSNEPAARTTYQCTRL